MEGFATPFACSICKEEFHKTILLERHVEKTHPSAKFSKKNIKDSINNLEIETQDDLFYSKTTNEQDPFEFVSINEMKSNINNIGK